MKRVLASLAAIAMLVFAACGTEGEVDDSSPDPTTTEAAAAEDEGEGEGVDEDEDEDEDEPEDETEEPEPEPGGTADSPFALGTSAPLGEDWEVAVTSAAMDASDLLASLSDWYEAPDEGKLRAIVTVDATYVGDEEGDAGMDLSVTLQGGNARQYDDTTCSETTPNPKYDAPTLTNGGQVTVDFCIEYEADAAPGASIFIEDTWSFDSDRVYWATA